MRGKVFLCYDCVMDKEVAEQIKANIEGLGMEVVGFWDTEAVDRAKRIGNIGIVDLINQKVKDADVTIVLITDSSSKNRWVEFSIRKAHVWEKGLIGIIMDKHTDRSNDQRAQDIRKDNPFQRICVNHYGRRMNLSETSRIYDWEADRGSESLADWVQRAALVAEYQNPFD